MRAFIRRAWLQQRSSVVVLPLLAGCLVGVATVVSPSQTVHGVSAAQFGVAVNLVDVRNAAGILPSTAFLVMFMPVVFAVLIASMTSFIVPGAVGDDVKAGGLEVILASPIPRIRAFGAYLITGMGLAILCWLESVAAYFFSLFVCAAVADMTIHPRPLLFAASVVYPLSAAFWSACVTLCGCLLFPKSMDGSGGLNGGVIRLLAVLPSLALVVLDALFVERTTILIFASLTISVFAGVAILWFTTHEFNSAKILGEQ